MSQGALLDAAAVEHPRLRGDHHFDRRLGHLAERAGRSCTKLGTLVVTKP